jgi:hypothetical protein
VVRAALLAAAVALVAGCGSSSDETPTVSTWSGTDESQTVRAGGFDWTVALFRELNPRVTPDREIAGEHRPADGHALWAAFMRVCNARSEAVQPPAGVRLVDAFGQVFSPVGLRAGNAFAYTPRTLGPTDCLPAIGSVAERVTDGVALVFELPFDALEDRPLFLRLPPETADGGARPPRIRLDV